MNSNKVLENSIENKGIRALLKLTFWPLLVFCFLSSIIMFVLFACGFYEMLIALKILLKFSPLPEIYSTRDAAAIKIAIRALEFFFLAPLPFLLVWSLSRYIRGLHKGIPSDEERFNLIIVKSLETTLFISIIAATIIAKSLGKEGLDYTTAISGSIVIIVFCAYLFFLEKKAETIKKRIFLHERKMPED